MVLTDYRVRLCVIGTGFLSTVLQFVSKRMKFGCQKRPRAAHWILVVLVGALVPIATASAVEPVEEFTTATELAGSESDSLAAIASLLRSKEYSTVISMANDLIQQIENDHDRYHESLVVPLVLLGDGLYGREEYDGALDAYDRARHISRLNRGLHNVDQVEITYREAEAYSALGNVQQAHERHHYAINILENEYGKKSPELLPGLFTLADWYLRNFNVFAARAVFEEATEIAKDHKGWGSPDLVRSLRGIATTYRSERFRPTVVPDWSELDTSSDALGPGLFPDFNIEVNNPAPGERALKDVVTIYTEQEPDSLVLASAKVELADWYLLFEKYNRANVIYKDVWDQCAESEDTAFLTQTFGQPRPLYLPIAQNPAHPQGQTRGVREGFVLMTFTVTKRGQTRDLAIVDSSPEGFMDYRVRKQLTRARYRPQVVDGKAVETKRVQYEYKFPYVVSKVRDHRRSNSDSDD